MAMRSVNVLATGDRTRLTSTNWNGKKPRTKRKPYSPVNKFLFASRYIRCSLIPTRTYFSVPPNTTEHYMINIYPQNVIYMFLKIINVYLLLIITTRNYVLLKSMFIDIIRGQESCNLPPPFFCTEFRSKIDTLIFLFYVNYVLKICIKNHPKCYFSSLSRKISLFIPEDLNLKNRRGGGCQAPCPKCLCL